MKLLITALGQCKFISLILGCQKIKEVSLEDTKSDPIVGNAITLICRGRGENVSWKHGRHNIT